MVKRDPEHTKQILELGGWGQHPDEYHQCVSTNAVPWLVSPHWLQDEGKLFPSVVQMVATLPVLHTLVDLHDPPGARHLPRLCAKTIRSQMCWQTLHSTTSAPGGEDVSAPH